MTGVRRRAICVSRDPAVRRVVDDALIAAGLDVEHHDTLPPRTARSGDLPVVAIVDRSARETAGASLCAFGAPVVVVGDDLEDDGLVSLMLDAPVSHVVGSIEPDRDLRITTEKLASGDLFGLEKYLTIGDAVVRERTVVTDTDKRFAVDEVCAWAESVGARRPALHRIASVVDELLMNALHDTPAGDAGPRALLRWASDLETIAISITDYHGALSQRDVIDNIRRARGTRGRPRDSQSELDGRARGAGLGLYLVVANVASLIVNVERNQRTEIVCLFDVARAGRVAVSPTRSIHVFAS